MRRTTTATWNPRIAFLPLLPLLGLFVLTAFLGGCSANAPRKGAKIDSGVASWYGHPFHGRRTASGEVYDMKTLTAAHKKLPFGTLVEVVNRDNGRSVRVRINDRGPFVRRRILDVSRGAAEVLGMIGPGTAQVDLYLIATPDTSPPPDRQPQIALASHGGATSNSQLTLQVGAFEQFSRAEALQLELRAEGFDAQVRSDGTWHRVHVGVFSSQEAAREVHRQLERQGLPVRVVDL